MKQGEDTLTRLRPPRAAGALREYWPLIRGQRLSLLAIVLLAAAAASAAAAVPPALRRLLESWQQHVPIVFQFAAAWAGLYLLQRVVLIAVDVLGSHAGNASSAKLRERVAAHLGRVEMSFYAALGGSNTQSVVIHLEGVHRALVSTVPWLLLCGVTAFGGVVGALLVSWQVALCALAVLPVLIVVHRRALSSLVRASEERTAALAGLEGHYHRWRRSGGAQLARLSPGGERTVLEEAVALSTSWRAADGRAKRTSSAALVVGDVALVVLGLVAWLGSRGLGQPPEVAVAIWAAAQPIFFYGSELFGRRRELAEAASNLTPVRDMLAAPTERQGGLEPSQRTGIEVAELVFAYPGRPVLLDGLTLEIPAGQRLALMGESGGGKSTLARLLIGLEQPGGGRIAVGGREVGEVDLALLRQQVGYLSQAPLVVDGFSLLRQLDPFCGGASMKQIQTVADRVGLGSLVRRLEHGYDTQLSESMLSGGEAQRIALGRALLAQPQMLILDEPFKGLDADLRGRLEDLIGELTAGCTLVWITHDLPPAWIDRVATLADGRISRVGTYEELSRGEGVLASLTARSDHKLARVRA